MKNKLKILIMVFAMISFFTDCFPQNTETLKKGSFYSFTLNNGSVIQGKVISLDSAVILLKTKNGLNEIQRQSILNIKKPGQEFFNDYFFAFKKPVYKKFISLNVGIISRNIPNDENGYYDDYYQQKLYKGFGISLDYTAFFNRSMAVRMSASYSLMKNKGASVNTGYNTYSRTGGNLSQYVLGLDLLAGLFHPEKKINFYALAGLGFGEMNGSKVNESNYYYESSYSYDPESQFLFKYGFGGGLTYSLSEKVALQTEVIYNYFSPTGGYYEKMDQLVIKAGIVFLNF